jgi:hypothetical protein
MQLFNESLKVATPEKDSLTLVSLLLPKLRTEDKIVDFFPYACHTSIFIQDALAAEAKSKADSAQGGQYICFPAKSSVLACEANIREAKVNINLESREHMKSVLQTMSPTVLLVDASEEDSELLSLPESLPDLRLVAYLTDKDKSNKVLPYLHTRFLSIADRNIWIMEFHRRQLTIA